MMSLLTRPLCFWNWSADPTNILHRWLKPKQDYWGLTNTILKVLQCTIEYCGMMQSGLGNSKSQVLLPAPSPRTWSGVEWSGDRGRFHLSQVVARVHIPRHHFALIVLYLVAEITGNNITSTTLE